MRGYFGLEEDATLHVLSAIALLAVLAVKLGDSSHTAQMLGSLLVAVTIVALTIVAVTAKLGPTSAAELDARDERLKQRLEAREEVRERRQDLREERLDRTR